MRKSIITTGLFFLTISLVAQKSIDGLVQAERNFSAYSVSNGTKNAFLKFADSTGVVFENGKAVNAIESWSKREQRPGKLQWAPEYAEIAASNDFGYTCGPWHFSINDTINVNGYYITVWHLNKNSQWRFMVDLGVNDVHCDFMSVQKLSYKLSASGKGTETNLRQAEEQFISQFSDNGKAAYQNRITHSSKLYRNKYCAAVTDGQRQYILDSLPPKIQYTIQGTGIASTADLGYVYGQTVINNKTDNYLRIWRKENDGWKIAVEVLRY